MSSAWSMAALSSVLFLALGGCGGKVLAISVDGGEDARTTSDAGPRPVSDGSPKTSDGASPGPGCPASSPSSGQSCSPPGLWCEYDVVQANPYCNDLWLCSPSSTWQEESTRGRCPPPTAPCPDSYADVPVNEACPVANQLCVYPTGSCGCTRPPSGTGTSTWACMPLATGCPSPIPTLGTSCTTPGLTCDYSPCGGGVTVACDNETWGLVMTVCQ
jgi:hypothetical protein